MIEREREREREKRKRGKRGRIKGSKEEGRDRGIKGGRD